jgi:ABC-type uncharacterized transport system substrate-binding protein
MNKKVVVAFVAMFALASVHLAQAQQARVYRVGVILEGGAFSVVVDGLKDGLKELGFAEGKHYIRIFQTKQKPTSRESASRASDFGYFFGLSQ